MARQTAELLRKARGFVARGWCQGRLARDADGVLTFTGSRDAVAWCARGAIDAVVGWDNFSDGTRLSAIVRAAAGLTASTLTEWNDKPGRTKEEVLRAFDRAIAAEEAS